MCDGFEAFVTGKRFLEWRLDEAAELATSQDSYCGRPDGAR